MGVRAAVERQPAAAADGRGVQLGVQDPAVHRAGEPVHQLELHHPDQDVPGPGPRRQRAGGRPVRPGRRVGRDLEGRPGERLRGQRHGHRVGDEHRPRPVQPGAVEQRQPGHGGPVQPDGSRRSPTARRTPSWSGSRRWPPRCYSSRGAGQFTMSNGTTRDKNDEPITGGRDLGRRVQPDAGARAGHDRLDGRAAGAPSSRTTYTSSPGQRSMHRRQPVAAVDVRGGPGHARTWTPSTGGAARTPAAACSAWATAASAAIRHTGPDSRSWSRLMTPNGGDTYTLD